MSPRAVMVAAAASAWAACASNPAVPFAADHIVDPIDAALDTQVMPDAGETKDRAATKPDRAVADLASDAPPVAVLRWEIPCKSAMFVTTELCPADRMLGWNATFGGDPAVLYQVTVRLRGLVEAHTFHDLMDHPLSAITPAPYMVDSTRAKPDEIPFGTFALEVPEPKVTYYFNAFHSTDGKFHHWSSPVDYTGTIRVRGGAALRMTYTDGNDEQSANLNRVVIAGVPPAPAPYNGQFLQLDVLDMRKMP